MDQKRRQPFSVVLLDEIEKAHGDVHDLLLQVLGEGRLTDGLGRTADFSNTVILLTSNLGTREAAGQIGFDRSGDSSRVYVKAAESFFRPEFFNRLDRIVPFDRLDRAELRLIARSLIDAVVAREGLVRRRSALAIDDEAVEWVVERGYHPELGARAMRRAVERELVQPVAAQLSGLTQDVPVVLEATRGEHDSLAVRVTPLVNAPRVPETNRPTTFDDPTATLEKARAFFERMEDALRASRPTMTDAAGKIRPEYVAYLSAGECLKSGLRLAARLDLALSERKSRPTRAKLATPANVKRTRRTKLSGNYFNNPLQDLFAAQDLAAYWRDLNDRAAPLDEERLDESLRTLLDQTALLSALGPTDTGWTHERVLLIVRAVGRDTGNASRRLAQSLACRFSFSRGDDDDSGSESTGLEPTVLLLPGQKMWHVRAYPTQVLSHPAASLPQLEVLEFEGHRATELLSLESGTHLVTETDGRLIPLQVMAWLLEPGEEREEGLLRFVSTAHHLAPVIRMVGQPPETVLDLRTGLTASPTDAAAVARTVLALLPLPPELVE